MKERKGLQTPGLYCSIKSLATPLKQFSGHMTTVDLLEKGVKIKFNWKIGKAFSSLPKHPTTTIFLHLLPNFQRNLNYFFNQNCLPE